MDSGGADEDLLAEILEVAEVPRLLVACGFDGALADVTDDPGATRADQQASEALNVLLALPGTTVAVVSRRPGDEVAELMFLSGSKGGLRVVTPDALAALRDETLGVGAPGTTMLVVDGDPAALSAAGEGDVAVGVGAGEVPRSVTDVDGVIAILEVLADRRR